MSNLIRAVTGGGNDNAALAAQQAAVASQQRRNLAQLARDQGETDQAAVRGSVGAGRRTGNRMLQFLRIGAQGQDTFG